jgi:hypothetical protein
MNWKSLLFWGGLFYLGWQYTHPPAVRYPASLQLDREPVQWGDSGKTWNSEGVSYTSLTTFEIEALVLSAERYRHDELAKIAPIDFLLGWGPMAKVENLERFKFKQYGRWGHLEWVNPPPIPADVIYSHSANMHMIPSTPEIKEALLAVEPAQVVKISGKLVKFTAAGGLVKESSLSRTDRDAGACEIVWVEKIQTSSPGPVVKSFRKWADSQLSRVSRLISSPP